MCPVREFHEGKRTNPPFLARASGSGLSWTPVVPRPAPLLAFEYLLCARCVRAFSNFTLTGTSRNAELWLIDGKYSPEEVGQLLRGR